MEIPKPLSLLTDQTTQTLVRRLVRDYAFPYRWIWGMGLACMLVLSAASVAPAKLIENVVNEIFIQKEGALLWPLTGIIFLAFFIKGAAGYGSNVAMHYMGQRIITDLQKDIFAHVIQADLTFFHGMPSGDLISRSTNDVYKLQNAVTGTLTNVWKDGLMLTCFIILMIYQDWVLAMLSLVVLPVAIFPIVRIGKRMRKASTHVQEHTAYFTILITQAFQGIRLIKSYGMEAYEKTRISEAIEHIFRRTYKAIRMHSATHPLMEFLGGVAIAVVILYGGSEVIKGRQTPGAFFSFIAAFLLAYEPLKRLANLNANLQEQLGAAARIFALIDVHPSITDSPAAQNLTLQQGEISFQNVAFHYHKETPVIQEISFIVPAGKTGAFVGASGAGKSTLMNLIPRFYDIQSGSICLDGQDIREVTLASLRQNIGLVSQEVILFDDTIRANIDYGRPGASLKEVQNAAKAAAAHDFIQNLPHGYETVVGEQGVKLSGGQRQRLSIARAMLKNAPILLLDEPTSALDSESEYQIQRALKHLMKGRTTLIIAHRLATIREADIIFVLEQGRILAFGTHQDLLNSCPRYQQLCQSQLYKGLSVREEGRQEYGLRRSK